MKSFQINFNPKTVSCTKFLAQSTLGNGKDCWKAPMKNGVMFFLPIFLANLNAHYKKNQAAPVLDPDKACLRLKQKKV